MRSEHGEEELIFIHMHDSSSSFFFFKARRADLKRERGWVST
jgi:hypothetical protein